VIDLAGVFQGDLIVGEGTAFRCASLRLGFWFGWRGGFAHDGVNRVNRSDHTNEIGSPGKNFRLPMRTISPVSLARRLQAAVKVTSLTLVTESGRSRES